MKKPLKLHYHGQKKTMRKKNAVKILESIEEVKNGEKTVTLILEDPFGHSIILHENAQKSELSAEDLKKLKTGFTTFENEDFED